MKKELLIECEKQIGKALTEALTSYNSPLIKMVNESLEEVTPQIKELTVTAVSELLNDSSFKEILNQEIKRKLAKVLIAKLGGELESTVNKLKADPVTRSKITVAIDSIISELGE